MNDSSENKSDGVSDKLNAAANLAKAVPIYDDALQPIMRETGKALSTVGRAVNVALAPVRGFVWGAEQVEEWLATSVSRKLEGTPEDEITTPDLAVAGPTIEALKFNGHKSELSEMFAGLLAGAMKEKTKSKAHPAYVDVIKSLTSLDARLFACIIDDQAVPTMHVRRKLEGADGATIVVGFLNGKFMKIAKELDISPEKQIWLIQSSIENLARLGLVAAKLDGHLTAAKHLKTYKELEESELFGAFREHNTDKVSYEFHKSYVLPTQFGKHLGEVVF